MQKIIDCHCHVYPDKIAARAVEGIGNFYNMPLLMDGTLSMLKREGEKAGITHYIVFSVATKPAQTQSINEFIAGIVAESGGCMTGLGTLHPESEDIAGDIAHLEELGLKGVKLHPDIQGFSVEDERCLDIFARCEGRLPVLLHTGDYRYDFSNPDRIVRILERFPNLTVIGAHLGGWSVWQEAGEKLSGYDNFYVDCSSSLYALTSAQARDIVRQYGAEHVLFATDYPMWSPSEELQRLKKLELTDEEMERILWKNAEELFAL